MKTKLKSIVALAILMVCMSSCVYSLFPIYTKDTLVYLPELEGKWQLGDDPDQYVVFKPSIKIDGTIKMTSSDSVVLENGNVVVVTQSMTLGVGGDSFVLVEGDTIRDMQELRELYAGKSKVGEKNTRVAQAAEKMLEDIREAAIEAARPTGNILTQDEMAYRMMYVNGDEEYHYEAHLAKIGEDIFLDLYATEDKFSDSAFGSNVWFPVHTFMKLDLENDQLKIAEFDLDKMNKLFDSNLIRMSHENVDGTILITARPEEIQKFLKKYSRDESVYEGEETYTRVTAE